MTTEEIRHRFRLALIGYLILATACVAGLVVIYVQQRDLRDRQDDLCAKVTQLARHAPSSLSSLDKAFAISCKSR